MSTPRFLTLPAAVRARRVTTPRGEFATLQAGRDGPLALLVPGWTGSKEDFIAVLSPLSMAGYRVVAVDQRGQYETPGGCGATSYTLAALADDLLAVGDELAAAGQPLHVVGHSLGGLVARTAVLRDPGRFATLTLLCSGPAAIPAERRHLLTTMAEAIPTLGLAATWQAKRAYERSAGAPPVTEEIERFLRRRFVTSNAVSLHAMTRHLLNATDEVTELADTDVPVLVAFGAADDGWPLDSQRAMAEQLSAPVRAIADAGHSPAVDQPDRTAAVLTEFWTSAPLTEPETDSAVRPTWASRDHNQGPH